MKYSILPADNYVVINRTILTDDDKQNLISFYEPIIGPIAVSLYLILWQDLSKKNESIVIKHKHLLNLLKCSESDLQQTRESLEAVGLLRTYVKKENVLNYVYELYSPLKAKEFFTHPILAAVLYSSLGDEEFLKLVNKFQKSKFDLNGYEEITKKMDEVYKVSNMSINANVNSVTTSSILLNSKIDYNLIMESIPKGELADKAITPKIKEYIDNLSFIYNVDTMQMVEFIRKSINEYGMIDKTVLRDTVRKNYSLSSGSLPTIVYRKQPEYIKNPSGDNSIHGKLISMFENVSPYDFLKLKNKGVKPTARDLKLVEYLLLDQELSPAVVNVLIDFCLKMNNNKLANNYVQTIAGQWKRAGLQNAKEAMEFASKEYKKNRKKTDTNYKKDQNVPTWLDKDIKKEEVTDEERAELEELLKEFK